MGNGKDGCCLAESTAQPQTLEPSTRALCVAVHLHFAHSRLFAQPQQSLLRFFLHSPSKIATFVRAACITLPCQACDHCADCASSPSTKLLRYCCIHRGSCWWIGPAQHLAQTHRQVKCFIMFHYCVGWAKPCLAPAQH